MAAFSKSARPPGTRAGHTASTPGLLRVLLPLILLVAFLLALATMVFYRTYKDLQPQAADTADVFVAPGRDLRLALDKLEKGKLYLFDAAARSGEHVRFLVQRATDGTLYSTLASCAACYGGTHPHYAKEGRLMCGVCNHPMHLPDSTPKTAAQKQCTLVAIPHSMDGSFVVVSTQTALHQAEAVAGGTE